MGDSTQKSDDANTQAPPPPRASDKAKPLWKSAVLFTLHVIIFTFLFSVLAGAALYLDTLIKCLAVKGLGWPFIECLKILKFVVFGADLIAYLYCLYRAACKIPEDY